MAVRCVSQTTVASMVLQEKQDHQEIAYESMREAIKEMEHQAGRLEEIHPDARPVLEGKVQVLLQGWTELGDTVSQNKLRLQEFVELQDFFRSYLAMISWTEDTRSCIFSDNRLASWEGRPKATCSRTRCAN
ncbi:hypothetical protein fugu_012945 [Takifugu bimaculatus]|uniref:Uncharacterized protein n=1 Tax=Takifugu bimaculatus TaxID=433685 RepID=A0A4Z2C6R1_9TELE|nr:hypothetical protein fugu_012945 [Takifugu bimaculatus]